MSGLEKSQGQAAPQYDLSIIIVGYNSANYLPACLSSIADAVGDCSYEVLFVNNGTDCSEALINREFDWVQVLPSRGNIGFAKANNYCAGHAQGQLLMLLNPDTEARSGSLANMVAVAKDWPEFGVLGGVTVTSQDGQAVFGQMKFPGLRSLARGMIGGAARPPNLEHGQPTGRPHRVDCVSGGCMMIRREAWADLGGFDERYFLYAEDIDLCRRAKDCGIETAMVSNAVIYHDVGSGDYFGSQRLLYQMRGNALYFRSHMGAIHARLCLIMLWLSALVRWLGGAFKGLEQAKYKRMSQGFRPIAVRPWRWWGGYSP